MARSAFAPRLAPCARGGAPHGQGIELRFGTVDGWGPVETFEVAGRSFSGRRIQTGVPHLVVPVERVDRVPVPEWGPSLSHHPQGGPAGTNVDFVARLAPGRIAMRTYERGVEAETLACGSGAMAAALWAVAEGDRPPIVVLTAGGDELQVGLVPVGERWDVKLTGPAEVVYSGEWTEPVPATAGRA